MITLRDASTLLIRELSFLRAGRKADSRCHQENEASQPHGKDSGHEKQFELVLRHQRNLFHIVMMNIGFKPFIPFNMNSAPITSRDRTFVCSISVPTNARANLQRSRFFASHDQSIGLTCKRRRSISSRSLSAYCFTPSPTSRYLPPDRLSSSTCRRTFS